MPFRDHFHPPVAKLVSWEAIHRGWPMVIVQLLARKLPQRYRAVPRIHLGAFIAIDDSPEEREKDSLSNPEDTSMYEVRVFDTERGQRLAAAIELVSPANKGSSEHRRAFCRQLYRPFAKSGVGNDR